MPPKNKPAAAVAAAAAAAPSETSKPLLWVTVDTVWLRENLMWFLNFKSEVSMMVNPHSQNITIESPNTTNVCYLTLFIDGKGVHKWEWLGNATTKEQDVFHVGMDLKRWKKVFAALKSHMIDIPHVKLGLGTGDYTLMRFGRMLDAGVVNHKGEDFDCHAEMDMRNIDYFGERMVMPADISPWLKLLVCSKTLRRDIIAYSGMGDESLFFEFQGEMQPLRKKKSAAVMQAAALLAQQQQPTGAAAAARDDGQPHVFYPSELVVQGAQRLRLRYQIVDSAKPLQDELADEKPAWKTGARIEIQDDAPVDGGREEEPAVEDSELPTKAPPPSSSAPKKRTKAEQAAENASKCNAGIYNLDADDREAYVHVEQQPSSSSSSTPPPTEVEARKAAPATKKRKVGAQGDSGSGPVRRQIALLAPPGTEMPSDPNDSEGGSRTKFEYAMMFLKQATLGAVLAPSAEISLYPQGVLCVRFDQGKHGYSQVHIADKVEGN